MTRKQKQLLLERATRDAWASVSRETDRGILTPRYTASALLQMGWQLSYGERLLYRNEFATAYVKAWQLRERNLKTGATL